MTLLEVNNLNVRFPTEDGVVHAVRDVSFSVDRGNVLGIVQRGTGSAPSASRKQTRASAWLISNPTKA